MPLSPTGRGLTLDAFFGVRAPPASFAFAASTTDPAVTLTEPTAADYARATLDNGSGSFSETTADGRKVNAVPIEWPTAASSWGAIGWIAVLSGETILGSAALAEPRPVEAGQRLTIPVGALVITIGNLGGDETRTGSGTIEASVLAVGNGSAVDPSGDALAIVPADRRTVWNPGIPGGIPTVRNSVAVSGLTLDGTGDNATAINNAIAAAGDRYLSTGVIQEVVLPAGTIRTASPVTINRSGVVLRGQGNTTRVRFDGAPDWNVAALRIQLRMYPDWAAGVGPWFLAADGVKGQSEIVLANASATTIAVGDVLCVDVEDDARVRMADGTWGRRQPTSDSNGPALPAGGPYRAVSTIVSVTGKTVGATNTTLALAEPLHMAFPVARNAQVWDCASRYVAARPYLEGTHWSGIENLYVTGAGVWIQRAAYCWLRDVEVDGNPGTANIGTYSNPGGTGDIGVRIQQCYRCEVRGCYVHHKRTINQGGLGYLVDLKMYTSETLVEDNILTHGNKVVVTTNCGGGNVIAYNYCDGAKTVPMDGGWQEGCIDVCHLSYSHSVLVEGNHTANLTADTTHGNSAFHLFFRNYSTGVNSLNEYGTYPYLTAPDVAYMRAAGPDGYTDETTWIGNVLLSPAAVYEAPTQGTPAAVWRIGQGSYWGEADGGHAAGLLYRHRNWNSATGSIADADPANTHPLPASAYLSSKPSFFGALPWPWVNPDGATPGERVGTLPAKARFDAM